MSRFWFAGRYSHENVDSYIENSRESFINGANNNLDITLNSFVLRKLIKSEALSGIASELTDKALLKMQDHIKDSSYSIRKSFYDQAEQRNILNKPKRSLKNLLGN